MWLSLFGLQLLAFLQGLFTFYHEGYELAHEFEPYKQQLQFNLQNVSARLLPVQHFLIHLFHFSLLFDQERVKVFLKILPEPHGVNKGRVTRI